MAAALGGCLLLLRVHRPLTLSMSACLRHMDIILHLYELFLKVFDVVIDRLYACRTNLTLGSAFRLIFLKVLYALQEFNMSCVRLGDEFAYQHQ